MWRCDINTKVLLLSLCLGCSLQLNAADIIGLDDVEIDSDQFSTNIVTSQSVLKGNVILRHQGMVIRCGLAEIFPRNNDNTEPKYLLSEQLSMVQETETYELSAQSGSATYLPVSDELIMQKQVRFNHQQADQRFEIEAENLRVLQKEGVLDQLIATGNPAKLSQTFVNKRVVIEASKINWIAQSNTAILLDASLNDGVTTFSASEIEYNTSTGSITAKGQGDDRPKYRFNNKNENAKENQEEQDNDT